MLCAPSAEYNGDWLLSSAAAVPSGPSTAVLRTLGSALSPSVKVALLNYICASLAH